MINIYHFLRIGTAFVALAATINCGCDRPGRAKGHPNYGSCLQATHFGITAVRKYASDNGHLPAKAVNFAEWIGRIEGGNTPELIGLIEYGGDDTLNLESPERTIVLKCRQKVLMTDGSLGVYCALLSGEILALHEGEANLGSICPAGKGEVIIPKP